MSLPHHERDLSDSDCGSDDDNDRRHKKPGQNSLTTHGYIEEMKFDTTIDLINAGDTVMQARRRGQLKQFRSPDFYIKRCDELTERAQAWTHNKATAEDLQWWGDEAPMSESWPTPMKQNLRILFANLGGIKHENDMLDVDILMQHCATYQVDVLMITEINLNLTHGHMRHRLREAFKRYDKHMKLRFAYPKLKVDKAIKHLMGSNMIGIQGGYGGRVIWTGADEYGRWSQMSLECNGQRTMFYCAYRVCTNTSTGEGTIATQETSAMQNDDHPNASQPRKAFMVDIERSVMSHITQGTEIIVGLDANADITSSEIEKFCSNTGMVQIALRKHPHLVPPRTYDRGKLRCMDIILTTPRVTDDTKKTGYLPLYAMGPIDHRFPYIDICCDAILRGYRPNPSTFTSRNFTMSRPSVIAKWCHIAKQYLNKAGIIRCVDKIEERLLHAETDEEIDALFKKLNVYDVTRENLYKAAATKCAPTFPHWEWSPTLAKHGTILRYWNTRQRIAHEYGDYAGHDLPIPQDVVADHSILTDDAISANIEYAQRDFNHTRYNSASIRRQHLQDLAERYATERNCSKEAALKQIITAEMARALHARHGHTLGKSKTGIREILVPVPHTTKFDSWLAITDPDEIHNILINTNKNSLLKSAHTPFAEGPLFDAIGEHANLRGADEILDGSFDFNELGPEFWSAHDSEIMMNFLQQLQRKRDSNGDPIKDMEWSFGINDYHNVFGKVSERTGCGPSGLTMNFWKAACYDSEICALNAKMIELPLKYGRPLNRWKQSIHIMIGKEKLPYAHRMRIIQKLEGDFNAAMKYTIGRTFMHHMSDNDLNSDSTYGGLKNKNCHQMLMRCQVTTEYCQLMRRPMVMADVDASGCYDRQRTALIGLVTQQNGLPRSISECQTKTLSAMEHRVQTAHGISNNSMTRNSTTDLGGSGQGSGASGPDWHCTNEAAIPVYGKTVNGCHVHALIDDTDAIGEDNDAPPPPDATPHELQQWVTSFVDDNNLLQSFPPETPITDITIATTAAIKTWHTILKITGGDLSYNKSTIAIMAYDHHTFRLARDNKPSGVPRLIHPDEYPDKCTFDINHKGCCIPLSHAGPQQGLKMLGVRRSMAGNFSDEFQYRSKQVDTMAKQIRAAKLDNRDMLMILKMRYYPAIRWCLPITTFTTKQCDHIQRPMINAALPKLGVNRHMPRVVVFGPTRYGGMDIMSLATEQVRKHIKMTLSHLRASSSTSTALHHLMSAFQIYVGCEHPFWTENPDDYPHAPPPNTSRISYLWHQLRAIGAYISVRDMWKPKSIGDNDVSIMSTIRDIQIMSQGETEYITDSDIHELNACRLYLKVTMLSDITIQNTYIHPWALSGDQQAQTNTRYPWQIKPPARCWKKWRTTLIRAFVDNSISTATCKRLLSPILPFPSIQPERLPWQHDTSSSLRVSQYIMALPQFYKTVLGDITLPTDDGAHLAHTLRSGNTVWSYTDGSVKDGIAAHSYLLTCGGDKQAFQILGSGETSGNPKTICSLRPEHSGALASLLIIAILSHKYKIPKASGHLNMGIDNITVVKRLEQHRYDSIGDDNHDVTDYDLWHESMTVISHQSATITTMHIKSHQDDVLKDDFGGIGPLPRHPHYNVVADKLAENKRLQLQQSSNTTPPPSIKAALYIKGNYIPSDMDQSVKDEMSTPPLTEYLMQRNDWNDEVFQSIDWDAHEIYLKQLPYLKAIKVIKYVHDWQNTGAQKARFDAQRNTPAHDPSDYQCPMKCGCQETQQHFLRCPIINSTKEMVRVIDSIRKWFSNAHTQPVMMTALLYCIKQWLVHGNTDTTQLHINSEHHKDAIFHAIEVQSQIGWDQFFKGRIASEWGKLQDSHYLELRQSRRHNLKKYHDRQWWTSNLIKQIIYVALNAWQMRNDRLHSNSKTTEYHQKRKVLLDEVKAWYDKEASFDTHNHQRLFSKTYLDRKNSTNAQLQLWTRAVSSTYHYITRQPNYKKQVPIHNFVHCNDPSRN